MKPTVSPESIPEEPAGVPTSYKYDIYDWLTDCAEWEGIMKRCPHCGEVYWEEEGHPSETPCPKG
jgi:hypothetical protein